MNQNKPPSMFTKKGWIQFPFCLVIRLPFATTKLILTVTRDLSISSLFYINKILNWLPFPEENIERYNWQREKAKEKLRKRFEKG